MADGSWDDAATVAVNRHGRQPERPKPQKKKPELSPEARERLRQNALQRISEGKLGGAKFGRMSGLARSQKRGRAARRVAEAAMQDQNAKAMIAVFQDAIAATQPMSVRLKGVELWLSIEREEGKLTLKEESADREAMSRDEMVQMLAKKLTEGPTAAILQQHKQIEAEVVQDAEVVEEPDDGAAASE